MPQQSWNYLPLLLILALAGCAAYSRNTFSEYQGASVIQGTGGTKRTVNGIDFWTTGDPPFPYRILGVLDRSQYNNQSFMSVLASANAEADLTKITKAKGGNGIIYLNSQTNLTGFKATQPAYHYGPAPTTAKLHTMQNTQLAIIQYLQPIP